MKLVCITFTGPDDRTNQDDLLRISEEVPKVEWGILLSRSMAGPDRYSPRFPSHSWLSRWHEYDGSFNLAGHLCGGYVRDILGGEFKIWDERVEADLFKRFQLNFHADPIANSSGLFCLSGFRTYLGREFIFQMDGVNEPVFHELVASGIQFQPLFDMSHGEGRLPDSWPSIDDPVFRSRPCGFAGGLGPDNLAEQLRVLADHVGDKEDVWVDMETKIRNDADEFDLDLVRRCIDIASPYF